MSLVHRVRQTYAAVVIRADPTCGALVDELLTAIRAHALHALPRHDQGHLCRVALRLQKDSRAERDLIVPALLHDIGKVSERRRVRLRDRIAKVLLAKFAPALLARLSARPATAYLEGLSLAVHHVALGAEKAAQLGCSPRTCWLIAHHEDAGDLEDTDLCLLVADDRETV